MAVTIDKDTCVGCTACVGVCPVEALAMVDGKSEVDAGKCVDCGTCVSTCPVEAIAL